MTEKRRLETGDVVAIQKSALDVLLSHIREAGYQPIGPQAKGNGIVYENLESLEQLPKGYVTEQAPGHFRLIDGGHKRYFDFIPGAQSWKQFLFPARLELLRLRLTGANWEAADSGSASASTAQAFIGVRACELAAIQMQDKVFLRTDFSDPIYRARRSRVFVLAVNCLHPAGTCFCASMSTGPRVQQGFDLCLTELDDIFLVTVGSELGRSVALDLPSEPASAFALSAADNALDLAAQQARSGVDPSRCAEAILENLEHPHWEDVAKRCLSCGNCTLVCPTCFCWDVEDHINLRGTETSRERIWDSCFNPGYSSQAGGNTRPTIRSRYRQWLSHKFSTWRQQFGTLGCVGCGRCVTWCPAGIDTREEVAVLQRETGR
jgi:sulfhydrogenase subunit beta (sulfur reductase)